MRETPLEVSTKYVRGVTWPITKVELLETMEQQGAPADVLEAVRSDDRVRFTGHWEIHMVLRLRD